MRKWTQWPLFHMVLRKQPFISPLADYYFSEKNTEQLDCHGFRMTYASVSATCGRKHVVEFSMNAWRGSHAFAGLPCLLVTNTPVGDAHSVLNGISPTWELRIAADLCWKQWGLHLALNSSTAKDQSAGDNLRMCYQVGSSPLDFIISDDWEVCGLTHMSKWPIER